MCLIHLFPPEEVGAVTAPILQKELRHRTAPGQGRAEQDLFLDLCDNVRENSSFLSLRSSQDFPSR